MEYKIPITRETFEITYNILQEMTFFQFELESVGRA
jgi:hypothetical protein